jgi:hypothetical protein
MHDRCGRHADDHLCAVAKGHLLRDPLATEQATGDRLDDDLRARAAAAQRGGDVERVAYMAMSEHSSTSAPFEQQIKLRHGRRGHAAG